MGKRPTRRQTNAKRMIEEFRKDVSQKTMTMRLHAWEIPIIEAENPDIFVEKGELSGKTRLFNCTIHKQ